MMCMTCDNPFMCETCADAVVETVATKTIPVQK